MRKLISIIAVCLLMILTLVSCAENNDQPSTPSGENNVVPHTHSFGEWEITKESSCVNGGEKARFCSCGEKQSEPTLAKGHSYVEEICNVCGIIKPEFCAHKSLEVIPPKSTSCSESGLTEGIKCLDCESVVTEQVEVPRLPHIYTDKFDSNCNVCGFERDVDCGHFEVNIVPAVTPTCTATGLTEGKVCAKCEELIQPQTVLAPNGHTEIIDVAISPTCIEAGKTEGKHCSVCKTIIINQSYVKALGHSDSEWIIEIEPTESIEGYKYKNCTRCGVKTKEESIPYIHEFGIGYAVNANGTTCTITGIGSYDGAELIIPDFIGKYKVTDIGENAFADCDHLTKIVLPETTQTIGYRAFYGCTGLTEFTIPESVTKIATQILYKASNIHTVYYNATYTGGTSNPFLRHNNITKVVFGGKTIPNDILYACTYVTEIEILGSVTSIGSNAFLGCNALVDVEIPDSVTKIGSCAFKDCTALESVDLGYGITTIGGNAFENCIALSNIEIPYGIQTISGYAFSNCDSLKNIAIPDSVTSLDSYVFYDSDTLERISIGNGITYIPTHTFDGCDSLKAIVIPDTITSIGDYAFRNCISLLEITLGNNVKTIGSYAFNNCSSVTSIVLPNSVTTIATHAFYNCISLENVVIPDSVTTIKSYAFRICTALKNITLPDSIVTMEGGVFESCPITVYCQPTEKAAAAWASSISSYLVVWDCENNDVANDGYIYTIIDGIRYKLKDGEAAIARQAKNLIIADIKSTITYKGESCRVTSIDGSAFSGCTGITEIEIPNSIISIGSSAFSNCTSLESITIPFVGATKDGTSNTYFGYIFGASMSNYNSSNVPSSLKTVVITGGTSIASDAFSNCRSLASVVIGDSVTSIGDYAFRDCTSLTSVVIGDSVTSIDSYAFSGCTSLTSVVIGDSVTSIGSAAFSGCESLTSIVIPDSVTNIGGGAFSNTGYYNNSSNWENDVLYIGKYLIVAKTSISGKYVIKNGTKVIGTSAFYGCDSLTSIEIPDSVTSIGSYAFYNCYSLTSIVIPDSVTSIGNYAFQYCWSLTRIEFNGTKAQWNAITKGSSWNINTGKYTIYCTDGEITK